MTYQKIFDLKFNGEVPTYELGKRFPKELRKISRIALLELPKSILRELIKQEKEFQKLMALKQWCFKKGSRRNGKEFT